VAVLVGDQRAVHGVHAAAELQIKKTSRRCDTYLHLIYCRAFEYLEGSLLLLWHHHKRIGKEKRSRPANDEDQPVRKRLLVAFSDIKSYSLFIPSPDSSLPLNAI